MFVATLRIDLLLGDVHSLKDKRSIVRPLLSELRRLGASVAEVEHQELHRRAVVGLAVVAADPGHCGQVLDGCERLLGTHPEVTVLDVHRVLREDTD